MVTGELFVQEGLITPEQLETALAKQQELGGTEAIASVLVSLGFIDEREKVRATGRMWGVPFVDVTEAIPEQEALDRLNPQLAKRFAVLPLELTGTKLTVVMSKPLDIFVIDEIRLATGLDIEPMMGVDKDIRDAILKHYNLESHVVEALSGALRDFHMDQASGKGIAVADEDDPAIGERPLLIDGMRPVVPACFLQLRDDKFAAGIGLVHRCTPKPTYADSATRGWPVVAEAAGEANDQTLTARPTRSIWRLCSSLDSPMRCSRGPAKPVELGNHDLVAGTELSARRT